MPKHFDRGKYRDEHQVIGPSLDAIERAYDMLLALPDRDSARFFRLDDHLTAGAKGDLKTVWWHLFYDTYNWLKFFWYSSAYKARQLAASLVHSYNTDNYLAWLILSRSTLEYAAVTNYFVAKSAQLQLQGPKFRMSQVKAFEDLMLQYAHGSRFDWAALMGGDRDRLGQTVDASGTSKAISVLTALKHLARRDDRYKDVQVAYEMLSDFAHPNMASHTAVIEMPESASQMHVNCLAACPGSLRGEFVMIVSLPWVSTAIGTTVELLIELSPLLETWLGYMDKGSTVTIDFTA